MDLKRLNIPVDKLNWYEESEFRLVQDGWRNKYSWNAKSAISWNLKVAYLTLRNQFELMKLVSQIRVFRIFMARVCHPLVLNYLFAHSNTFRDKQKFNVIYSSACCAEAGQLIWVRYIKRWLYELEVPDDSI